jgi:hypothetical protein
VTTGYFAWDLLVCTFLIRRQGVGFFLHALMCFGVFLQGFRPFLMYFALPFLQWEVSSCFLALHWALDKVGKTGSKLQLANGIVLLSTFFYFRLVYGLQTSYEFWQETGRKAIADAMSPTAVWGSRASLAVLTSKLPSTCTTAV